MRTQQSCADLPAVMDLRTLEDAVRDMDRRKVQEEVGLAAKSGLDAAASVGTETPMVLLRDIRRCMLDMSEMLREFERERCEREAAREIRKEQEHSEIIATLQQMSSGVSGSTVAPRQSMSRDSMMSMNTVGEKREFYDHNTRISTGAQVVAAVLMQLDSVLQNSGQLPHIEAKDTVILDLKGWSSPILKVSGVESANTANRPKVNLPKQSQQETITVLEKVSSTTQGRTQSFRVADVVVLQNTCPSVMGIVEEIRQRLLRCPGILPESRRERLAYLRYPYATRDAELNVSRTAEAYKSVGPVLLDGVSKLKDDRKKFYVSEVLTNSVQPIVAYNKAKAPM